MTDSPAPTPTLKTLTAKQRAFVNAYISSGFNATQSALTAGYSAKTAYSIGSENLRKPEIKAEIEAEIKALFTERTMSAQEVLMRLTDHARGDLGDFVDDAGTIDWVEVRAMGKTGLLKRIKRKTRRERRKDGDDIETIDEEIELHNPQIALQLLGKHHGLFVEKIEHTGKDGGPIEVKGYKKFSPDDWDV